MDRNAPNPASMRTTLLLTYLAVLAAGILVLLVAVRLTAPNFFDSHVGAMSGMDHDMAGGMMSLESERLNRALVRSLNEAFVIAAAISLPLAVAASFLVARQLSAPVGRLAAATRRIARGEYDERVEAGGPRELHELAGNFNMMAQALEGAERRRMQLIGDVAHELRTPVSVLRGYVEGLADGVVPASEETWSKLGEETMRLNRLVEDLQELSRAEAGQLRVSLSAVNPGAAIAAALSRLEPAYAQKGVILRTDIPQMLPAVKADPDRLVQVLTNLLSNALSYTPAPGTVTISVRATGDSIAFAVRDTGIGIAPEHLDLIFERFYRVDLSRSRASGGSGVGLTIARALVQAMGGQIRVESEGFGKGATFTVSLPASGAGGRLP